MLCPWSVQAPRWCKIFVGIGGDVSKWLQQVRPRRDEEELDKKFTGTEVETLKGSLARVELESRLKADRIQQLEQNLATLQHNLSMVTEILKLNPSRQAIETAARKRSPSSPE